MAYNGNETGRPGSKFKGWRGRTRMRISYNYDLLVVLLLLLALRFGDCRPVSWEHGTWERKRWTPHHPRRRPVSFCSRFASEGLPVLTLSVSYTQCSLFCASPGVSHFLLCTLLLQAVPEGSWYQHCCGPQWGRQQQPLCGNAGEKVLVYQASERYFYSM